MDRAWQISLSCLLDSANESDELARGLRNRALVEGSKRAVLSAYVRLPGRITLDPEARMSMPGQMATLGCTGIRRTQAGSDEIPLKLFPPSGRVAGLSGNLPTDC
jgi:hypothetical protein